MKTIIPLGDKTANIVQDRARNRRKERINRISHCNDENIPSKLVQGGALSSSQLQRICGTDQLQRVKALELLSIDSSSTTALGHLTDLLPALRSLVLDGSTIQSFRDIGFGLQQLTMLSVANCNVSDLDGFGILSNLREVRLAYNKIVDLTPLALHEYIEHIDLSNNEIEDFNSLVMLGTCSKLRNLDIRWNPIILGETFHGSVVEDHIPQLDVLNGKQIKHKDNDGDQGNTYLSFSTNIDSFRGVSSSNKYKTGNGRQTSAKNSNRYQSLVGGGSFEIAGNAARSIMRRRSSLNFIDKMERIEAKECNIEKIGKTNKFAQTHFSPVLKSMSSTNLYANRSSNQYAPISSIESPYQRIDINQEYEHDDYSFVIDDDMSQLELEIKNHRKSKDMNNTSFTRQKCSRQYWKAKVTAHDIAFDDDMFKGSDFEADNSDEDYLDLVATRASMKHLFR